jgi:hypothetical protein
MSILNKNVAILYCKFYILLQLFITLNTISVAWASFNHPQMELSKMKFRNPGNNGQSFYSAKEAMNLVTTIDLTTCRCINTFVAGKTIF